ncbi:MAG: tolA protein [Polaromonas sp.]|jgi:hypothetical protein|nr:tolA protein [Polaromonas sp.]
MNFSSFTLLTAFAGFATGLLLCWLAMRGGAVAKPATDRPETLAELAQSRGRIRQLEDERQMALKNYDDLKHQTARARDVFDIGHKNKDQLAESAAQVAALQAQLATVQALENATRAEAALARSQAMAEQAQARDYFRSLEKNQQIAAASAKELQLETAGLRKALELARQEQAQAVQRASELPVLEEQVIALQNLEKSIKKEFQLLAELQRNVTLTAATRIEFNDSNESRTTASTAT